MWNVHFEITITIRNHTRIDLFGPNNKMWGMNVFGTEYLTEKHIFYEKSLGIFLKLLTHFVWTQRLCVQKASRPIARGRQERWTKKKKFFERQRRKKMIAFARGRSPCLNYKMMRLININQYTYLLLNGNQFTDIFVNCTKYSCPSLTIQSIEIGFK